MRGTIAKRIRRQVYGIGHHPGPVLYLRNTKGTVKAGGQRQRYQLVKKQHSAGATRQPE
jgi:hypothetical protein